MLLYASPAGLGERKVEFCDLNPHYRIGAQTGVAGSAAGLGRCVDVDGGCRNVRIIAIKGKRARRAPVRCIFLEWSPDPP
jgi:hypothetical protein